MYTTMNYKRDLNFHLVTPNNYTITRIPIKIINFLNIKFASATKFELSYQLILVIIFILP